MFEPRYHDDDDDDHVVPVGRKNECVSFPFFPCFIVGCMGKDDDEHNQVIHNNIFPP